MNDQIIIFKHNLFDCHNPLIMFIIVVKIEISSYRCMSLVYNNFNPHEHIRPTWTFDHVCFLLS